MPVPIVTIQMFEGRSLDKKRELSKQVTDVVARITDNPASRVHVIIEEVKQENWTIGAMYAWDFERLRREKGEGS
jgi:4-oxalocrotonate tautomerase